VSGAMRKQNKLGSNCVDPLLLKLFLPAALHD
jgi:hypothetical protein